MSTLHDSLLRLMTGFPYSVTALLARFIVGLEFFLSGLTKIDGFGLRSTTFFLFEQEFKIRLFKYLGLTDAEFALPFPQLLAYATAGAELLLPILLWAGLLSRYAALGLLAMTIVIELIVPQAFRLHGLWAIALLMILTYGPGKISLDHWLGLDRRPDQRDL